VLGLQAAWQVKHPPVLPWPQKRPRPGLRTCELFILLAVLHQCLVKLLDAGQISAAGEHAADWGFLPSSLAIALRLYRAAYRLGKQSFVVIF
jgi:hypothetical protein